jgi:3-dehydroquinate synthase
MQVALGSRSYPILIGRGLGNEVRETLLKIQASKRPIAVITDQKVEQCQAAWMDAHLSGCVRFSIPSGEPSKNLTLYAQALEFLATHGMDRSAVVVAFGGGVVGDFAGFVAASYMRGLDFIQIPTTLLAMVDSSVGGKTGVNLKAGKNLVGAFHQPKSVFIDLERLDTLDPREFSAGMAELIKAGLLADATLFERLESLPVLTPRSGELALAVQRACEIKATIVAGDERESAASGGRALLNLGHTFGHAIEQNTGYTRYLHGEAISIGMVMAAQLSAALGNIPWEDVERIKNLLQRYQLPIRLAEPLSAQSMFTAMGRDKKKQQGSLRYVLLDAIGQARTQAGIRDEAILQAMQQGGVL